MDNFNLNTTIKEKKLGKAIPLSKVIFIILGIILLIEVIYAVRTLAAPTPPPPQSAKKADNSAVASVGKITLATPKVNYSVNELIPITVIVDTASKQVNGVDIVVRFDPKVLDANTDGLIKGAIFDEYPILSVDKNKGMVSISGVSNSQNGFQGVGKFATINLKAKAPVQTTIAVDFEEGSTSDSNLVSITSSKDILERVDNLDLIIQ